MSLATAYRPKAFKDVVGQDVVVRILERQIESGSISHNYLFVGPSGCGKTTLARIMADRINKGNGKPIEIDAASNNGVDNVRSIIAQAKERSVDSEYKIFVIDECHAISTQGWQAFLKCIEEPPKYTIFIFCTTEPSKVPETIQNRVQMYALSKIRPATIEARLNEIARAEGATGYEDSTKFISNQCDGGMRTGISMLEKALSLSKAMSLESTVRVLGKTPYTAMFFITNALIDMDARKVINGIERLDELGENIPDFIDEYAKFIMDLCKYCIYSDIRKTSLPESLKKDADIATGIEGKESYYGYLLDGIYELRLGIKNQGDPKTYACMGLLHIMRGYRG